MDAVGNQPVRMREHAGGYLSAAQKEIYDDADPGAASRRVLSYLGQLELGFRFKPWGNLGFLNHYLSKVKSRRDQRIRSLAWHTRRPSSAKYQEFDAVASMGSAWQG